MKALPITLVLVVLVGISLEGASAAAGRTSATYTLRAKMTSQQVITPANKPWRPPASVRDARGTFTGTLTIAGRTRKLAWRITYRDIGPSTLEIADVHLGRHGRFGQILVRLCGPCRSGQNGTKRLSATVAKEIKTGNAWVTVITSKYPNGVIRGQIKVA
jgi:hypothetical protein